MAFVAAPLRRLSATIHKFIAFSREKSLRILPTKTSSFPATVIGIGYSLPSITTTLGVFFRTLITSYIVIFSRNWMLTTSECPTKTGTLTAVAVIFKPGKFRILRDSFIIFSSSFVYPLGSMTSHCGIQFKSIWWEYAFSSGILFCRSAFNCSKAFFPEPETAW